MPKHFATEISMFDIDDDANFVLRSVASEKQYIIPRSCLENFKTTTNWFGKDIVMCEAPKNV